MLNPKMQTIIRRQDFTANIGVKKYMHQASLSMAPLTVPTSVTPMNTPLTPTTPGSSGMPALTRETLALRLRQNWLAKHPVDTPPPSTNTGMDDSLTSLNWLQNLNIMKIPTPTPPASPQPGENSLPASHYTPTMQVNPNAVLNMAGNDGCLTPPVIRIKQEPGLAQATVAPPRINNFMDVFPPQANSPGLDKIDYKTNPCVKPPYSYATLICMAMKETKKNKITLAGIYNWITENFMYYKVADPSWQNSIRHNLSLNKCFQKVPRRKDEPGKGGFWRINPEYEDMFINGIFKKRRGSTSTREIPLSTPAPSPLKRVRREMEDSSDSSSCEPSTSAGRPAKVPRLTIKQEPGLNTNTDVLDDTIDFNWNSILSADIEVGGVTVKTEDIIDGNDDGDAASPITAMSPPPSESSVTNNSDDIVFEDFFNNTDFPSELEEPLDFTTGGPLDLSISGNHLKAPEWWEESIMPALTGQNVEASGLHTPIHVSGSPVPDADEYAHPWAEDKVDIDNAVAVFDADITHLFDMDNVPSPNIGAPESS